MQVYTTHPDYSANYKRWKLVRDIIANNAMCHLRTVDPSNPVRSAQYKEDAILTNFTRLTRDGLKGLVFRKESVIDLPSELEYLREDATGEGLGLEQLMCKAVGEVLETGRYGLLVDYPKLDEDLSDIDREASGMYARMKAYKAENIINFKRKYVGSRYILSLVVLMEYVDNNNDDPFAWDQFQQYRCLYLDENGIYTQAVYRQGKYDKEPAVITPPHQPQDRDGNKLKEIPFVFIGSENNDCEYDTIPLYDLAVVNRGHYANSADAQEASFICGQPMAHVDTGDTDAATFKEVNGEILFGSRSCVVTQGGKLELVQAGANILPLQLQKDAEAQAISIGARFIPAPSAGRETAEGARIRLSSSNSSLYLITYNVSDGIEKACKWTALFQGATIESIEIQLNDEFYDETADPNLIIAQIQLLDKGVIAKNDIREYGRKAGFISETRTNEQLEAESEVLQAEAQPAPVVQPSPED